MKFSAEGVLKIFDFGLARAKGVNAETQGFKGTHGFAAPELYISGHCSFTQAIDTYAFGATALYLAAGPTIKNLEPDKFDSLSIVADDLKPILKSCFSVDPLARPLISMVSDVLARHLLRNKHQAIAVINGISYILNAQNPRINLKIENTGELQIDYNGLAFLISKTEGTVHINNSPASIGAEMPGSCVITFGGYSSDRRFVTFDVSNPEVVL
jgi:serine/threonine-protein kinase